jgi:uncharacterized repeat protein (TIGR01451 family)
MINPSEAGNITKLADFIVRSNAVDLLSIGDTLAGAKTYSVPVDSTLTSVTFSVSGTTNVTIKRPDGSTVQASDPGVSTVLLSGGGVFSIINPASGSWSIMLNGSGVFSLAVIGESSLDLSSFRFVELGGRPGHEGFFPIKGLPLAGEEGTVDAVMTGMFGSVQFEFRSKAGAILQTFSLPTVQDLTDEFSGKVTPPDTSFLVYATGTDSTGAPYQRVLPDIVKPQTVTIIAPPAEDLRPGQTTTYIFKVRNTGPAGTFQFLATDDKGFITGVSPTTFTLNTNETQDVTVMLRPPMDAVPGTSDTLTVTVRNTATGANNFAVLSSSVASGQIMTMADLAVVIGPVITPARVGQFMTYRIDVTNYGPEAARGVKLTDTIARNVFFTGVVAGPAVNGCVFDPGTRAVTCDLGTMDPSASKYALVTVRPQFAGPTSNTASAAADIVQTIDPVVSNNADTRFHTILK